MSGYMIIVELIENNGDSDQTPRSVGSVPGLHCLAVTRLGSQVFNDWFKQ